MNASELELSDKLQLREPFVELQKEYHRLFQDNKDIMAGIHYAQLIQQGILPQGRHLDRLFKDYFVIYRPQSIIGGDLFWVGQKGKLKIFAVADCTGHGVSGALLSILALSFLNYIVLGKEFQEIHEVLEELDKKWLEAFHQGIEHGFDNDWMEIGLCSFNTETRELQYSGVFNKLTCITPQETICKYGSRYPIGGWQLKKNRTYTNHSIVLPENSTIYLYTDGFKDQFGELSKKRYGSKRLSELIEVVSKYPLAEQKTILEEDFLAWKGQEIQTDDMCMLGIKL
jgi:sigma-B regulation protein RsbU (phosphoserine phosphatase)